MRKVPVLVLLVFFVVLPVRTARAAAPGGIVAISEIYGGGGNKQAKYANDFVELFNRTRNPIDLTGWSVGYSSKTSTVWRTVPLSGSIAAYKYYLVRLGTGGGGGSATLPTPDVTASTNIARSAGKVRVSRGDTVIDLVGYGKGVNASEGKPAPGPTDNVTSIKRLTNGCVDTNRNDKDLLVRKPGPRNTASPGYACGSAPVLAPIGSKRVQANTTLAFAISGTDPDGDPLTYSAAPLPSGARFTPSTRTFDWKPTPSQVGDHRVTFRVSDGFRSDTETVTITVTSDPQAGMSAITLDVTSDNRRHLAAGRLTPPHPGSEVTVKLFRKGSGGYRRVAVVRPTLDAASSYRAAFRRPASGSCLVTVVFRGDSDHSRARAERAVRC